MEKKNKKQEKGKIKEHIDGTSQEKCSDKNCPFHGRIKSRGRIFEGKVTKKFPRRVVIEFDRMIYVRKYERYSKSKTKIHARIPSCMVNNVRIGDTILVQECRPLSKIIHFVVIRKIREETKPKESKEKIK